MAQVEEQIISEGTQLIWVMTELSHGAPGTAENCRDFMDNRGSDSGLCVGDSQTMPTAFLIDRKGVIRHVHKGFRRGDIEPLRARIAKLVAGGR